MFPFDDVIMVHYVDPDASDWAFLDHGQLHGLLSSDVIFVVVGQVVITPYHVRPGYIRKSSYEQKCRVPVFL